MPEMLFYKEIVSLDSKIFAKTRILPVSDYSFAGNTNSLPLAGVEFGEAAKEYPIVFTKAPDGTMVPLALVGLQDNKNLFVGEDNQWAGRYIPAYVRRYPFITATTDDPEKMNVCVDKGYSGFDHPDGERLFTDDGKPSAYLSRVIDLMRDYFIQGKRTVTFCERLMAGDLFRSMDITYELPGSGKKVKMTGLFGIDQKKLHELPDDKALEIFRTGELAWVYSHLISLSNVARLGERLSVQ